MLDVFIGYLHLACSQLLECHQVNPVLREQLEDLHFLVDLHVAVLSSHAPVQEFVEVNVSVHALDGHLKHLLLQLCWLVVIFAEAERARLVTIAAELSEELRKLLLLNLLAAVPILGLSLPHSHETSEVTFEGNEHIVFGKVILLELLDNNEDEKIEHDMCADEYKQKEVSEGCSTSACLSLDTTICLCTTAVKHDLVPVFSGRHCEEKDEC